MSYNYVPGSTAGGFRAHHTTFKIHAAERLVSPLHLIRFLFSKIKCIGWLAPCYIMRMRQCVPCYAALHYVRCVYVTFALYTLASL
jgi:hypothetical protein